MKAKNYPTAILLFILTTSVSAAFVNSNSENVNTQTPEPTLTLIETLENGEHYSIEITSVGCFNGTRQTVLVYKQADVITASCQNLSKILSDADIEVFKTFEIQLRALKTGGCSTVDTYVLRFGNEEFRTSDGSCSWHGGKKLIEVIS